MGQCHGMAGNQAGEHYAFHYDPFVGDEAVNRSALDAKGRAQWREAGSLRRAHSASNLSMSGMIVSEVRRDAGAPPRFLTLFVYLNDVHAGGEVRAP